MLSEKQIDFIVKHTARTTEFRPEDIRKVYESYNPDLHALEFSDYGMIAFRQVFDYDGSFGFIALAILVKNEYYIKEYRSMIKAFEAFCRSRGANQCVFSANRPSMCRLMKNLGFEPGFMTKRL